MGVDCTMYVLPATPLSDKERKRLSGELNSRVPHFFWITHKGERGYEPEYEGHALMPATDQYDAEYCGFVDAPEGLLRINTMSRYYGPGYERGHWPSIKLVGELLDALLPGCKVWYGGDSGGTLDLFTAEVREDIHLHFIHKGHTPYRGYTGPWEKGSQSCSFCGDRPMNNVGGGGDKSFWSCDGCGYQIVTRGGVIYPLSKDEDFFAASRRIEGK